LHTHSQKQAKHTHSHNSEHSHVGEDSGRLMKLLGSIAHEGKGLSDYRSRRLVPASNHVIVITIFVLLVGVILAHLLPSSLGSIAWIIVIVAAGHLALLVIGGLLVTLLVRHQRSQSRRMVIDSIPWRGTEMVLDVACGTGMLLNGCARQLTTGKAVGVDLWQQPIAGSANVLMSNARAEGVAGKVQYQEMDACHLTFEDQCFNVVVSSFALHHIGTQRADREQALSEMIRVLAPSGYLSLVDTGSMIDMADEVISQAGLEIVRRQRTHFFQVVTARKPTVH
jgi:ubiquinone/menaquinone biosynthesis C-methylase UbiE